jgi:hypothetical protein
MPVFMCFFVCLTVPKSLQNWNTIAHGFDVLDVTAWNIGKATLGNGDRDTAFLITAGGCSCFISGASHRSGTPGLNEFESLIQSILRQTPRVRVLIHYASGDISKEEVIRKGKRMVLLNEVGGQLNRLELDVRYIIAN